MLLKTVMRVACTVLAALLASACIPEHIEHKVLEQADENDSANEGAVGDRLACVAIEELLLADLPRSEETSANAYDDLSFQNWCERNIVAGDREDYVGNARAWEANEGDPVINATSPFHRAARPTLAQGARLDLHALKPRGTIPFVRKIHFANWEGPNGNCALEMRVYQENIGESGKKPLLYFHGGGWRNRATTMTAAEMLTTQLVDEHIVFMPAYPLHDNKDGPEECREADFEDILASAQQAFDWVVENKDVFGATGAAEVDVMGHSAGGQLAAWVATQNRERTGKLVNFYGPVEFAQFIDEARPGGRYEKSFARSKGLLASLFDVGTLAELERPYPELVTQNSLAEIIKTNGAGAVPPFFMVQGTVDTTVPVEQALLACNALGGSASTDGGIHACPGGGFVGIVEGAGHNLDRRCVGNVWPLNESDEAGNLMDTICPNADADYDQVRTVAQAAFDWLDE